MLHIAENVAADKRILRKAHIISGGWWRRFLECNPKMSLRAGMQQQVFVLIPLMKTTHARDLNFKDHPQRIYNMD